MDMLTNDVRLIAKRRIITTDNHLAPPPWLVNELPAPMRPTLEMYFGGYEERNGQALFEAAGHDRADDGRYQPNPCGCGGRIP